jgi:Putative beta barrel porin-7 (BBP7)
MRRMLLVSLGTLLAGAGLLAQTPDQSAPPAADTAAQPRPRVTLDGQRVTTTAADAPPAPSNSAPRSLISFDGQRVTNPPPAGATPGVTADEIKPPPPAPAPSGVAGEHAPLPCLTDKDCCKPRLWAGTDYLLWWVKKGPVDTPLVTFNPSNATAATLVTPGTTVLFGPGNGLSYDAFSGVRATIGGWLDSGDTLGIEGSGFLLERRPVSFSAFSAGNTALGMPVNLPVPFAGLPAGPTAFTNGNGAGIPETIIIQSSSQLWDAEANVVYNLLTNDRVHVQLLGGFRYLDLSENLRLSAASPDAATGGEELFQDGFQTRNQFYGPQLGTRLGVSYGRLSAELTALVALGPDHETLSIDGNSTVTKGAFGLPTGTFIGGVYAQPSNIGTFRRDVFSVIPEARLQVGYDVTRRLRATVGYDFLYVSDVLRPGNQIDANVNANQSGLFGTGTIQSPALPAPLLQRSDYWAQGITFGLEFRF